jgi:hypothetical protein
MVTIPDENRFYSLFSDGNHAWKSYDGRLKTTRLVYPENAVVVLYYTYPTHREACVIRNNSGSLPRLLPGRLLPGLSKKVSPLFSVHASKVDKLKRAVAFLKKHVSAGAFSFDDGFYIRLFFIISQRGKLNYPALAHMCSKKEVPS